MKLLDINNLGKPKLEKVELPEVDSYVYIKQITAKDRQAAEELGSTVKGNPKAVHAFKNLVICLSACDEKGELLFKDNQKAVDNLPALVVDKLYLRAEKLNFPGADEIHAIAKN
jgi:hypothetical protein